VCHHQGVILQAELLASISFWFEIIELEERMFREVNIDLGVLWLKDAVRLPNGLYYKLIFSKTTREDVNHLNLAVLLT